MKIQIYLLACLLSSLSIAQPKIEEDLRIPYQNAIKGVYWALENIPVKKMNLENDLIADNQLYANVRLSKEINGVKIKSTGYYNSCEVAVILYRTYESLEMEGFMSKDKTDYGDVNKEEAEKN